MSSHMEIAEELKTQMINLIDDLLEILPNEKDIFTVRVLFDAMMSPTKLIEGFIEYVLPWKEYITNRDETYFEKNDNIFGSLPAHKVQYFKTLYKNGVFGQEEKETIWQYFDVFVSLAETYKKQI